MSRRGRGVSIKRMIPTMMQKGCGSKARFEFEHEIKKIIADAKADGVKLYSYRCKYCQGYHLTRQHK